MKKSDNIPFENIGGSFQFHARCAADLTRILTLDATVWAALCVPVTSLNGDNAFFQAMDSDGNGMIRVDEVKEAIRWLANVLTDINVLDSAGDTLPVSALDPDDADGKMLRDFVTAHRSELDSGNGMLELSSIRAKLAAVTAGTLAGDGMLKAKAVENSEAADLYKDITTLLNCPDKLTSPLLEKFFADAASFVQWADTVEKPLYNGEEPEKYYNCFKPVEEKIDEYFRFCELIRIDPAHAVRFELAPDKLPELDLQDPEKVNAVLAGAPLVRPDAKNILDLEAVNNPFYQEKIAAFAELFSLTELSSEKWQQIKADLAPYIAYLAKAQGDTAGQLGKEKLELYLNGNGVAVLRELFVRDQALGGIVDALKKLERLLLYTRYLPEFVNNFVSFAAFFDKNTLSMLQAGRLVMDGRSYRLAVWIDDIAAHKRIAMRSNLCLLYLEVTSSGKVPVKRKVAVAVTAGNLNRIYVGKPAYFVDSKAVTYTGKIVDMVEGPISFCQTLFAPLRRLADAVSGKLQKLTDFSSTEKQLAQGIEQGKLPAAAPAKAEVPASQKFLSNGAMMMLAGGLSLAAVGAGLSFVFKSIANGIATISALPLYIILIWIAVFIAIFMVPMAIFAWLRMRKRNLTLFLEAGGWAVNLPMRLSILVSRIFTQGTEYPPNSKFINPPKVSRSIFKLVMIALVITAVIAAVYWWYPQYCQCC